MMWLILECRQLLIMLLLCNRWWIWSTRSWTFPIVLWLTMPTSIITIVISLLLIMYACPLSILFWFMGLVGSFPVVLLVYNGWLNRSTQLVSSWSFLFLGMCIQFSTVLSWRRLRVSSVALHLILMISCLFTLLQLLLGIMRLRIYWAIIFVVGVGPLNGNFLSSSVAIHFRRPPRNQGRTWLMHPLF